MEEDTEDTLQSKVPSLKTAIKPMKTPGPNHKIHVSRSTLDIWYHDMPRRLFYQAALLVVLVVD